MSDALFFFRYTPESYHLSILPCMSLVLLPHTAITLCCAAGSSALFRFRRVAADLYAEMPAAVDMYPYSREELSGVFDMIMFNWMSRSIAASVSLWLSLSVSMYTYAETYISLLGSKYIC